MNDFLILTDKLNILILATPPAVWRSSGRSASIASKAQPLFSVVHAVDWPFIAARNARQKPGERGTRQNANNFGKKNEHR